MAEIRREYNFRSEKLFMIIKIMILALLNANSGGKHGNTMNLMTIYEFYPTPP